MNEVERNKILFLLLQELIKNEDYSSIRLIQTFVNRDNEGIKMTFKIMTSLIAEKL
jgi:hypothetical protein